MPEPTMPQLGEQKPRPTIESLTAGAKFSLDWLQRYEKDRNLDPEQTKIIESRVQAAATELSEMIKELADHAKKSQ